MNYKMLFTEYKIGPVNLRNRIVHPAVCTNFALSDGSISQKEIRHLSRIAQGGAGLIFPGCAFIDAESSKGVIRQIGIHNDEVLVGLEKLAKSIQKEGAKTFLQIGHTGRRSRKEITGFHPVAPSPIQSAYRKDKPLELSATCIKEIVKSFAISAKRAKDAGFDGVELHGGHAYLIAEFISPKTNLRIDEYGGDFWGRLKFPLEIIKAVRQQVGDSFPLGMRMSADEYISGGINIKHSIKIAKVFQQYGIDYLHVSAGCDELGSDGATLISSYLPHGIFTHLAEAIKKEVNIPVIAVGSINTPELAEKILLSGKADLIAIARSLIAEPDWVKKAFLSRKDIRPCIRCNECIKNVGKGYDLICSVNPQVGTVPNGISKSYKPKKVVVVGGGPAGLEAARVCAEKGYQVILFEKKQLGGTLSSILKMDFKEDLIRLIDYLTLQIIQLSVKKRMGEEATVKKINEIKPDVIMLATGNEIKLPSIPGINNNIVANIEGILESYTKAGSQPVVLGAGLAGCETALFLARKGMKVTIISKRSEHQIAQDLRDEGKYILYNYLLDIGVNIKGNSDVMDIISTGLRLSNKESGNRETIKASRIIIAQGFQPNFKLKIELNNTKVPVYFISRESDEPDNILTAIHKANITAHSV